jgi:hypothetical protein
VLRHQGQLSYCQQPRMRSARASTNGWMPRAAVLMGVAATAR